MTQRLNFSNLKLTVTKDGDDGDPGDINFILFLDDQRIAGSNWDGEISDGDSRDWFDFSFDTHKTRFRIKFQVIDDDWPLPDQTAESQITIDIVKYWGDSSWILHAVSRNRKLDCTLKFTLHVDYVKENPYGVPLPGLGTDISVGAGGSVWVVGTQKRPGTNDFGVYRWNGSNWDDMGGGGIRLAVDPNGNAWLINSKLEIFRHQNASWTKMPGLAVDVGVGADGTVCVIGTDQSRSRYDTGVHRWNGTDWKSLDGYGKRISVGPDGNPWVLRWNGDVVQYRNGSWGAPLSAKANDIGVGPDGSVWTVRGDRVGTDQDFGVFRLNSATWDNMLGGGVQISVGPGGKPWLVNSVGEIFWRT
jgi:Tectonin domain